MAELLHLPGVALPNDTPEPTDAEARELALDIHRSWIVEAPAGSGKTSLLVARYLRLLAEAEIESPESILAITFTRKATAELRERMLRLLAEAASGAALAPDAGPYDRDARTTALAVLERDRRLGWHLLDRPGALNIRTIDGLCAEIAQSLPLLTGGGGRRQPTDDPLPLYELAADRTLRRLGGADQPLHEALRTVLLHRDVNLANVRSLLADMLQEREQWGELLPLAAAELTDEHLDTEVRPRLEATLGRVICAGLARTAEALPQVLFEELSRYAAEHAHLPGYNGAASPIRVCHGRHRPPGGAAEDVEHWRALINLLLTGPGKWRSPKGLRINTVGFELKGASRLRLTQLVEDFSGHADADRIRERLAEARQLPPGRLSEEQWQVCRALFYLLRHALAELEVLFDERGACDFPAISLAARAALRSADGLPDLAAAAGYRLEHLLVDELQDTSAAQFELFELLTRHFDGGSSTVFLVGDPKQSIYLFRQARVERFLRTASTGRLGDVPLQGLRLRRNFRSQGALVEDFNTTFRALLPSPAEAARNASADVPFVAAEPTRAPASGPAALWHPAILDEYPLALLREDPAEQPPSGDLTQQHRLREATLVRQLVEDFAARWPTHPSNRTGRPPRMAILCRNRGHVDAITAELRRDRRPAGGSAPIPFRAVDLEALRERPEVLDALALTRALLHPGDRIAWLAVLRAPWCGLKLADLLTLTGDGIATAPEVDRAAPLMTLIPERAFLLSDDGQRRLATVWPTLERAAAAAGRAPLAPLAERTWLSLGGDRFLSPDQRANVRSYLHLLQTLEIDGAAPDGTMLETRLRKLYAAPESEADLEITTIHKSKGREWDLVILPGLERKPRGDSGDLLQWMELEETTGEGSTAAGAEIILSPIAAKGGERYPLSTWLSGLEKRREAAERKRLFYVACTRAREELHLIAAGTRGTGGALQGGDASSLLRSAWPYAQAFFTAVGAGVAHSASNPESPSDDLEPIDFEAEPLALAAEADPEPIAPPMVLERTPDGFDPLDQLRAARAKALPHARVSESGTQASQARPVGSFGVRAFGNVVHRFLNYLADRMADGGTAEQLLAELPQWRPRLSASLRAEGLPPTAVERETPRVQEALAATLSDRVGRWILAPHLRAASERPLMRAGGSLIRADRVFFAAAEPGSDEPGDTLWIIDFKTTDPGGRDRATLATELRDRYRTQLEVYAAAHRAHTADQPPSSIHLGLYLPGGGPQLITWVADREDHKLHPSVKERIQAGTESS